LPLHGLSTILCSSIWLFFKFVAGDIQILSWGGVLFSSFFPFENFIKIWKFHYWKILSSLSSFESFFIFLIWKISSRFEIFIKKKENHNFHKDLKVISCKIITFFIWKFHYENS
jgi:hypothetical protein